MLIRGIDNIAVNLIGKYQEIVLPADSLHLFQLLPGPNPARGIVGTAKHQHPGPLRLFLQILKMDGNFPSSY